MKKIYIVLTYTGTILSKLIKKYTKDEFAHASIALDNRLKKNKPEKNYYFFSHY